MGGKYWDRAWSLVDGCTHVSEACDHCWLKAQNDRFKTYDWDHPVFRADRLDIPLRRKPPTVYCIWSDLFHEAVTWNQQFDAFITMACCPEHTFLVLTKRPEMARSFLNKFALVFRAQAIDISNVWLGVTAENQRTADERIPLLLQAPAAHRFVSVEPMLGEIVLDGERCYLPQRCCSGTDCGCFGLPIQPPPHLDLVICGGESGHGARPMHPDWARSLRGQCATADVPFVFKQWGPPNAGRLLDGREHNDLPWRASDGA